MAEHELMKHKLELEDMKGLVARSVLASDSYVHFPNNEKQTVRKQLIAITVLSARDYKPHVIIAVNVNGNETLFARDTKKAIEFYNKQ